MTAVFSQEIVIDGRAVGDGWADGKPPRSPIFMQERVCPLPTDSEYLAGVAGEGNRQARIKKTPRTDFSRR